MILQKFKLFHTNSEFLHADVQFVTSISHILSESLIHLGRYQGDYFTELLNGQRVNKQFIK